MDIRQFVVLVSMKLVLGSSSEFEPCGGKPADVFFILDSSGSITMDDFRKEVKFTEDVSAMFDTASGKVRVGVVSFSKDVIPQFGLGEYTDRGDMLKKVTSVEYQGMGTNTAEALSYLHVKGLAPERVRPDIPHIAIVLTDGMSADLKETLKEAKLVHDAGISVFVIGIGIQVDDEELSAIGSKPSANFVFTIDNFDALAHIKETLAIKACEVLPATPAPKMHNTEAMVEEELSSLGSCTPKKALDITFAIDTAGIGASNTKYVIEFIDNISEHLNMAAGDVSISVVNSGCTSGRLAEDTSFSADAVRQGLSAFEAPEFNQLMRSMRLRASDGRRGTEHVGVVFVGDRMTPKELWKSVLEMKRARFQKTSVYVIGVGEEYEESQAKSLATVPGQYFHVFTFPALRDVAKALLYSICLHGADQRKI